MNTSQNNKQMKKLIRDALESLLTIKDCLELYYQKKQHMFKPIAGQLRILYCDKNRRKDNSLLSHIYPDLKLIAFKKYELKKEYPDFPVKIEGRYKKENHMLRLEGYVITKMVSGLQIADLDLSDPPEYLALYEWCEQLADVSLNLKVRDIILSVANKGGGSHIDLHDNPELSIMKRTGPAGVGLHVLFIIALARFTMRFANQFTAEWSTKYPDLFEYLKKN